jgi:hypothetical protein
MKRRLSLIAHLLLVTVAAMTLLSGTWAFAQSKAKVYIPFAFTANHQTMPAGHYSLELLSDRFLCFRNSRTGEHQAVIMVQPASAPYIETRGRLRFLVSDYPGKPGVGRYYLTEIQFAGSSMHSTTVLQPSFAREMKTAQMPVPSVDLAMK